MKFIINSLKWFNKIIVFILSIMFAGLLFILSTNSGLHLLVNCIAKFNNGSLVLNDFKGSLLSSVKTNNIVFTNAKYKITLDGLDFNWQIKDLIFGKINVKQLYIKNLNIQSFISNNKNSQQNVLFKKIDNNDLQQNSSITDDLLLILQHKKHGLNALIKHIYIENLTLESCSYIQNNHKLIEIDKFNLKFNQHHLTDNYIIDLHVLGKGKDVDILIDGTINRNNEIDLLWNVKIALPQINSNINSVGSIKGQTIQPIIDFTMQTNSFNFNSLDCRKLWFKCHIDFSLKDINYMQIKANALKFYGFSATNLDFKTELKASILQQQTIFKQSLYEFVCNINLMPIKIELSHHKAFWINKFSVVTSFNSTGLNTKGQIVIDKYSPLSFDVKMPSVKAWCDIFGNQELIGKITWNVANIAILQNILPENLQNIQGRLNLDLNIVGTTHKPRVLGKINFIDSSLYIQDLGVSWSNINCNFQFDENKRIQYKAVLHSTEGVLKINGTSIIDDLSHYDSKLTIQGNNFLAINTKEYTIAVDPNLNVLWNNSGIKLNGSLNIPTANIAPASFSDVNSLPPEITFVNEKQSKSNSKYAFFAKVKLTVGNKVKISIMGLQGMLRGSLELKEEPNKTTLANGSLYVLDGFYLIYGQKLQVNRGVLNFFGSSVVNPELNIEAIREFKPTSTNAFTNLFSNSITVGIRIHGMLDNLKTDLFSLPEGLAKQDILSYLIIGRPSSQASGYAGQMLLQTISSLNLGGSKDLSGFVDGLKNTFGFSEFGFIEETQINHIPQDLRFSSKTDDFNSNAAFVLGKYLTSKIFISYSMGLLNAVNIFRVKYYINDNWSLQNENSSFGNGVDLMYIIEKN